MSLTDHTSETDSPALPTEVGRIVELDGFRGFAILLVLIWHYVSCQILVPAGSLSAYLLRLMSYSWCGVDMFFVLSGYLLGSILIRKRLSRDYFRSFYIRRAFRILPVYYLVLAVYGLSRPYFQPQFDEEGQILPLWSYFLHVQNLFMAKASNLGTPWLAVTWSLAVEEQFYLFLPLLIWMLRPRFLPWVLVCLILSAPATRVALFLADEENKLASYVLLPCRWDAMFLGALGAWFALLPGFREWMKDNQMVLFGTCLVLVTGMIILLGTRQLMGSPGMITIGHTWVACFGLNLLMIAQFSEWRPARIFFRNKMLVFLGTISYGLYLYHQIVSGLCHMLIRHQRPQICGWMDASATLLALAISVLIAHASWHMLELPLVRIGHSLTRTQLGQTALP